MTHLKIKTQILYLITFSSKIVLFMRKCEKILYSGAGWAHGLANPH